MSSVSTHVLDAAAGQPAAGVAVRPSDAAGAQVAEGVTDSDGRHRFTDDRIMATSLVARWRHADPVVTTGADWDAASARARSALIERSATVHSLALQQTLGEMGRAVLEGDPGIAEIRLSAPNRHHFLVDLSRFGLDNPGEVFHADDRPYGLIEASMIREHGDDPGLAWYTVPAFA